MMQSFIDRLRDWFWDAVTAAALLTRLPLPRLPERALPRQAEASWAYPLPGGLVAGLSGLLGASALGFGLDPALAAGVVLAAQVMLTGAMHEDGLADTADGFWGGWDPQRRLEIMKDSQIGSYGVMALLLVTGLRWIALALLMQKGPEVWLLAWIATGLLSRAPLPAVMAVLPPARASGLAKSVGRPAFGPALVAVLVGTLGASLLIGGAGLVSLLGCAATAAALARLARAKIGGVTGDVLGAIQQTGEVVILTLLLIATS